MDTQFTCYCWEKLAKEMKKIGRREDRRRYHASALYVVVDVEVV